MEIYPGKFKVYMTDFFLFAGLNLLNVLICIAKKIFESDFPLMSFRDFKLRETQISDIFLKTTHYCTIS